MSQTLGLTLSDASTSLFVPDHWTGQLMLSGRIFVKEGAVGLLFHFSKLYSPLYFYFDHVQ